MDMYKLKFTRLQNEIFRLLCIKVGISLNQRGIARMLKVSPTAISKSLPLLEKEGLTKIERKEKMNFISVELNRDNPKTTSLKRVENLKLIYESGLVDFLEKKFLGCDIILFGSYSQGEDTIHSDIDIAVNSKRKGFDLTKFDKMLERTVIIHNFEDFKNIRNKNLVLNISRGIVL